MHAVSDGVSSVSLRRERQAFAGMIWSKQLFYYGIGKWIKGDPSQLPPPSGRKRGRNHDLPHLNYADIISMPDTWEYRGMPGGTWRSITFLSRWWTPSSPSIN